MDLTQFLIDLSDDYVVELSKKYDDVTVIKAILIEKLDAVQDGLKLAKEIMREQ